MIITICQNCGKIITAAVAFYNDGLCIKCQSPNKTGDKDE